MTLEAKTRAATDHVYFSEEGRMFRIVLFTVQRCWEEQTSYLHWKSSESFHIIAQIQASRGSYEVSL